MASVVESDFLTGCLSTCESRLLGLQLTKQADLTAGGVAFLSGTVDYYVRGYDLANGREIWKARLPAGGQSTPATYLGRDGRQYLVVVAGGHRYTGTKTGDSVIAYALPAQTAEPRNR